jgi:hypothetical protein
MTLEALLTAAAAHRVTVRFDGGELSTTSGSFVTVDEYDLSYEHALAALLHDELGIPF